MKSTNDRGNGPATKRLKQNEHESPRDNASQNLVTLSSESPILSLKTDGIQLPVVDPASSSSLLKAMVFPLSPVKFLQSCFRRKALHIAGTEDRVDTLAREYLFHLDADSILSETSSDNVFVWLSQKQSPSSSTTSLIQSVEISDPSTASALHKAGHATYCRAPPELEQLLVSRMLAETGMGCGQYDPSGVRSTVLGRGEVEVFMGTSHHLTDWHYDFQENFTLQLSGSKRWTLKQGTVKYPLRGCTPHYAAPEAVESQIKAARLSCPQFQFGTPGTSNATGNQETILVQAGDMLYFPAGMWHKVETVEPGVSINISLMATNYAALTCQALHHLLLTSDSWRETVVSNSAESAADKLKSLLQELPSIVREFEQRGGAQSILPPTLLVPPRFKQVGENDETEQGDMDVADAQSIPVSDDGSEGSNDSADGDSDADELDEIVDVVEFEAPDGWSPAPPENGSYEIVKNPLASLTSMDDITKYYKETKKEQNGAALGDVYLLNVNYAGNDMHESSVRVLLRDSTEQKLLAGYANPSSSHVEYNDLPPCLLFYGFFQWADKNKS